MYLWPYCKCKAWRKEAHNPQAANMENNFVDFYQQIQEEHENHFLIFWELEKKTTAMEVLKYSSGKINEQIKVSLTVTSS